jgi:hypothetical protein
MQEGRELPLMSCMYAVVSLLPGLYGKALGSHLLHPGSNVLH